LARYWWSRGMAARRGGKPHAHADEEGGPPEHA
jgi:hypothetical protein